MSRPTPAAPDRWIFAGLLALLVWLPLPNGSKPAEATAFFGLVAALLAAMRLGLTLRGAALPTVPSAARLALALWTLWIAWIAIQLLPLPPELLAHLSPVSHARHAALLPAGSAPLFTLSILPSATLDRLLLSLSYLALFWTVLITISRNRERQRLLLRTVMLVGLAQALYAVIMTLSGLEYGFLEPKRYGIGITTGTFVNRNHFAGNMELALSAGIALILADLRPMAVHGWRQRLAHWLEFLTSPRIRVRVMLVVMVIALVLTRSRMGNIAFFASLAVCGSAYMFLRHKAVFLRSMILFLSLILVDLLIVSEHYGLDRLAQRLEETDLETEQRLRIFRDSRTTVGDYWLTGSGLGTFAAAYSPHRSDNVYRHIDHAHNDHLELLIETGIVGYGILAMLAALLVLHGLVVVRRRQDATACALGFVGPMALACMAIHGLADFNLQIPANAALLVTLMAATFSCSSRSLRSNSAESVSGGKTA